MSIRKRENNLTECLPISNITVQQHLCKELKDDNKQYNETKGRVQMYVIRNCWVLHN